MPVIQPVPPPSGLFKDTLDSYFFSDNFYDLKATDLWTQYLVSIGKPLSFDPDTDPSLAAADPEVEAANRAAFKAAFVTYAQAHGVQDIKQTQLWAQFLQVIGKPVNYDPTTDTNLTPAQLQTIQLQFMAYVQQTLLDLQTQQVNLSSDDEIKKREIMFRTFEILLKMLATLQDTIGTVGHNLIFYGKWQEAYTNMLTKVPTYVGGTQSVSSIPNPLTIDNVGTAKFGYADINLDDIAHWAADAVAKGQSTSLKIAMDPAAQTAIKSAITQLTQLDGSVNDAYGYGSTAVTKLKDNSYLQVSVDAATQKVTFTLSGVDFTQVANSANPTVAFPPNQPAFDPNSGNLVNHINETGLVLTGIPTTNGVHDIGIGEQWQTGSFDSTSYDSTVNTWLVKQVTSPAASVSSTNLDSNVTSIKTAFQQFMSGSGAAEVGSLAQVAGIRLFIGQKLQNLNGFGIALAAGANVITKPTDQTWTSDYSLSGQEYSHILQKNGTSTGVHAAEADSFAHVDVPKAITTSFAIPWIDALTFTSNNPDPTIKLKSDNASKARAEVNAKLQQYIENIRSRRQIVQDQAKQVESTLSQAKESVSQQANLLTSILDSLKSLTSAIFR